MCLMIQLWAPTSIQSQLPGATKLSALSLHLCFCHQASQAVEKLYCARRWATSSLIVKHLSHTVREVCAEGKNAVSEATDWGMQTFAAQCRGGTTSMNIIMALLSSHHTEKFSCWPVTLKSSQNHISIKIGEWVLAQKCALVWGNTVCVWQSRVQLKHAPLCNLAPQSTLSWCLCKGQDP